jgi:ArsR family transcriptional regulator, lead/cadmium/zinc/bismuth-responsive transcriptional repressor
MDMVKDKDRQGEELCGVRCIHRERVVLAQGSALSDEECDRLAQLFKAMGDCTRLRILRALEEGEICVCDLAMYLRISESAVSHQLRQLRQLHLVANRREGPVLYYRLDDQHVSQLVRLALEHIRE